MQIINYVFALENNPTIKLHLEECMPVEFPL